MSVGSSALKAGNTKKKITSTGNGDRWRSVAKRIGANGAGGRGLMKIEYKARWDDGGENRESQTTMDDGGEEMGPEAVRCL